MSDSPSKTTRTLYLHVGHRKTGSSYIQYCLAASRSVLQSAGIDYPISGEILQQAINRLPTSGNGLELARALKRGDRQVVRDHLLPANSLDTLYSAEQLLSVLSLPEAADLLFSEAVHAQIGRISILLFIREPVDHVVSAYGQEVKRNYGNFDVNIEDYFAQYNQPAKVLAALEAFGRWPDLVSTEVHNYSRCTEDLADLCFHWLGFGASAERGSAPQLADSGESKQVNRSLTVAEFEFCKSLMEMGMKPNRLSDALVSTLPEIRSDLFDHLAQLAAPQIARLSTRLQPVLSRVNPLLPAQARYASIAHPLTLPVGNSSGIGSAKMSGEQACGPSDMYGLNAQQIRVICDVLTLDGSRRPQRFWMPALTWTLQRIAALRAGCRRVLSPRPSRR